MLLPAAIIHAATNQNVSKSYHATQAIPIGSIVSLETQRNNYVVSTTTDNAKRLIGVAVKPKESLIAINPGTNVVQVATAGSADVLVSTVNGTIHRGDKVAASPFEGIGMKSTQTGNRIVGVALADFDADGSQTKVVAVKDKNGGSQDVKVGYVPISLAVGTDASGVGEADATGLQRYVQSLTGHSVSMTRILIGLVIAIITLVALMVLLYAAISGSLISIGRNPLAKTSILRGLIFVLIFAVVGSIFSFAVVYLIIQ